MKTLISASAIALAVTSAAHAEKIGVTMAAFDDNFLTVLRTGMQEHAATMDSELQLEDAQNEVGRQLNQIQNFVASGVDAIIVNPVDTDATIPMTQLAEQAGIPLVFVNREPVNLKQLPATQAYVGSLEIEAGNQQGQHACELLKAMGKTEARVAILMGDLSNQAARLRTQGAEDIFAGDECGFIEVVEKQTAMWQRTLGSDMVTNWLSAGLEIDAVLANNDEMAVGAAQALRNAGADFDQVVVAGVDGTIDAKAMIQSGEIDHTVFQDAVGQGHGAVDAAVRLARGEEVEQISYIPFQLITPENLDQFASSN
ncbi:sugar ABC transporter substrate-binding protein [Paracoccus sp. Z330]|uniref:Sugar ABC transporter substrate-binding protein n=1 Tax=Paracoccus onchidii TaxID=3017813 RepID=A0ABT4ZCB8_9RHOB|nr:sugar ABC transporter substrate-binding protein [Paracoccus onchidii]MDB6177013.1 sugar ABC transporter substrate-binding protein [Paracoccus onchidii]